MTRTGTAWSAVLPALLALSVAPRVVAGAPLVSVGDEPPIELLAADGAAADTFGWRVSLAGDAALVGAPFADTNDRPDEGAAYVFRRDPLQGTWSQEAKLTALCDTVVVQVCGFGTGVALAGNTVLIGAPDADPNGNTSQGAAYVFARDPQSGEWTEEAKLTASDGAELDQLGTEVALADGIALVGAPFATVDGIPGRGAAYLFERDPVTGTWVERAKFTNPDGDEFDELGAAVALSGETALVGEPFVAVGENEVQGVAHVFVRDAAGDWSSQARLLASDGALADDFGAAVALSGDLALIGARGVDVGGNLEQGAAYVFVRDPGLGTWTEQAKFLAAEGASQDFFASHLALAGETALIGAPSADSGRGAAYVFEREPGSETWTEIARLDPPAPELGAGFGIVALADTRLLIGAPHATIAGNPGQGVVYVFALPEGGAGLDPVGLAVDADTTAADGNGVFEPGETVVVAPAWRNNGTDVADVTGIAAEFSGPGGASYTLVEDAADYGLLEPDQTASCLDTGVCYQMSVDDPAVRPATLWVATFEETLSDETTKTWTLHIGDSFTDVPRTSPFYRFVETLLHEGVTGGCAAASGAEYCPHGVTSRGQMSAFVLAAKEGPSYTPPACVDGETRFDDVPFDSLFCPWIEELARRDVVAGCGGENYCPNAPVTRAQAAVFLLRTLEGEGYTPPPCDGIFTDVDCPSTYADWVEELFERGVTRGCSTDPLAYCPSAPSSRAQMAVLLTNAFDLLLYGP